MLNRSTIVLSDLHLGPTCPPDVATAAARVFERHPDHEIFLMGDTFDLSIDPPPVDPAASVVGHLSNHPELVKALRKKLERGVPVAIFAGNHDAQLAHPHVRGAVLETLGVSEDAPLSCGVWCQRRDGVHFEHGHVYDPDNAPTHPLAPPSQFTEPLGVTLMRRVLAPSQALSFAHAHELTPLRGLGQAFVKLGPRAPELILRYYLESARIFFRARSASFAAERLKGSEEIVEFAKAHGFDVGQLQRLIETRAMPRHHRKSAVFGRLYLDRSIATAVWWSSSLFGVVTLNPAFWLMTGGSLAYLGVSLSRGKNRYGGSLLRRLHDAACTVALTTGARAVVFGHTHVEEAREGYVNTGSFGFGGAHGKSYVVLDTSGKLSRVYLDENRETQELDVLLSETESRSISPSLDSMVA